MPALTCAVRTDDGENPRHERVSTSFALLAGLLIAAPACGQPAPQPSQSPQPEPQQPRPPARTDLGANVRVFEVPPGSRPHDVAPAPDGKVWYTGQRRGTLGILDPDNGQIREVQLGEGSAPHGVIQGPDGAAWITDGGLNAIVRYDPRTDAGQGLAASGRIPRFQPQHRRLRPRGPGLVHRPDRRLRSARSGERRDAGLARARRPRSLWHRRHAFRRNLLRLARRQPSGPGQSRDRRGDGHRAADRRAGRAAGLGRQPAAICGSRNGMAASSPATTPPPANGRAGGPKATGRASTPSMSTIATSSGSAISAATPSLPSIPPPSAGPRYPGSGDNANVRQILGAPGWIYLPESGLDRIMVVRTAAGS